MEKRVVTFPVLEALRFSIESIRRRFLRAAITAFSVVLSIAFTVGLLTTGAIVAAATSAGVGIAMPQIAAYQYWTAVIAVLVTVVGIVNSMLMAVNERVREIGVMKCLGALHRHILLIFLFEASIIGLAGGIVGCILGLGFAVAVVGSQFGFGAISSVSLGTIGLILVEALSLSVLLSAGAAVYPAYSAAKLRPAEALRRQV